MLAAMARHWRNSVSEGSRVQSVEQRRRGIQIVLRSAVQIFPMSIFSMS